MNKSVSLAEMLPVIEEVLSSGGEVSFITAGTSMLPMLRNRQDKVVLIKPHRQLRKYDIPLYRRDNGRFILHRILGQNERGYILAGDNQCLREYGITDRQIIAVVKGFYRNGKYISCRLSKGYRLYCITWTALFPVRKIILKVIHFFHRAAGVTLEYGEN